MPIDANTLKEFRYYDTFIETGCGSGFGIDAALAAGFKEIYSIELYRIKYEPVRMRFLNNPMVSIILGHSSSILVGLLPALSLTPCVFWLDAHYDFQMRGEGNNLEDVAPILKELDAIKNFSKVKNHTILIDDLNDFRKPKPHYHNITEEDIKKKILEINPAYKFATLDGVLSNGTVHKKTILLAEVPQ